MTDHLAPGSVQQATLYQPLLDYFEQEVWQRGLRELLDDFDWSHIVLTLGVIKIQLIRVRPAGVLVHLTDSADTIAFATDLAQPGVGFHLVHLDSSLKGTPTAQLEEQRFRLYAGLFEQLAARWPKSKERQHDLVSVPSAAAQHA